MSCNIALFTDSDAFAGTERHILNVARGLRSVGGNLCVVCPSLSPLADRVRRIGLSVVGVPKNGLFDPQAIRRLVKVLRGGFDIIHAHNGRTAFQAALAVRLAACGKLVITQHFIKPNRSGRSGVRRIASGAGHRWLGGQVAHFIAISTAVRTQMLARGDCPPDKVTTVLNGIADPRIAALRSPEEVRRELGLHSDTRLIVCAARLEAEKGIGTLIEAMGRVVGDHPTVCAIAGAGSQRDQIQRSIESANLTSRVRLLGFRDNVHSLMLAADVFVLPSPDEPFGLALVEAMALGKPVVACRSAGPLEIVADGDSGLLVPPGDGVAMADAISRLLKGPGPES